jgi:uncharacterized protein YcfJ
MKILVNSVMVGVVLAFSGCAEKGFNQKANYEYIEKGRVLEIRRAVVNENSDAGTLVGTLIGGYIGNRIGGGGGKILTTGAGALLGGYVGNIIDDQDGKYIVFKSTSSNRIFKTGLPNSKISKDLKEGDFVNIYFKGNEIIKILKSEQSIAYISI